MTLGLIEFILSLAYTTAWLFLGYIITCCTLILIKILYKLRNEVFNEQSKIKPSHDQVILITGATSGIGLALARFFYRKGFSIIATRLSENEPDHLTELMHEKHQQPVYGCYQKIFFVNLDVRCQESIKNSHSEVKKILEDNNFKLYTLINNAGVAYNFTTNWSTREQLATTVQVNLLGPILMVRQYTSLLAENPGSRIVFVGSILSKLALRSATYCATKAALNMLSEALSMELRNLQIKVRVVNVGNLLRNTSILANSAAQAEQVYSEFTEDEKRIYKKGFEKHVSDLKKVDRLLGMSNDSNAKKDSKNFKRRTKFSLLRLIAKAVEYSSGVLNCAGSDLDNSYLMRSFEIAVLDLEPPADLYGGNMYYSTVSGSVIEFLSGASWLRGVSSLLDFGSRSFMG